MGREKQTPHCQPLILGQNADMHLQVHFMRWYLDYSNSNKGRIASRYEEKHVIAGRCLDTCLKRALEYQLLQKACTIHVQGDACIPV
jgi:hypothetical protein